MGNIKLSGNSGAFFRSVHDGVSYIPLLWPVLLASPSTYLSHSLPPSLILSLGH